MSKQLLLGDEAIAQAALDAGLSGVYAYPGTPLRRLPNTSKCPRSPQKKESTAVGAPTKKPLWKLP